MELEQQLIHTLQARDWRLVDPLEDPDAWYQFVKRVEAILNESGKTRVSERQLNTVLLAAYGEVLYAAGSDATHPQRRNRAFEELGEWIYRKIYPKRTQNKQDAYDLRQSMLETIFLNWDRIAAPRVLFAFTSGVIRNRLREYYRRQKRQGEKEQPLDDIFAMTDDTEFITELQFSEAEEELYQKLVECMPNRAKGQVRVLALMAFKGMTPAQIAQYLQKNVGNVYTILSRARQNFFKHCRDLCQELISMVNPALFAEGKCI